VAGIVAIYNLGAEKDNDNVIYYLAHAMLMLQHRGKAYWQMAIGSGMAGREGSFPSDDNLLKIVQQEKLYGTNGIGYLSKRSPQFPSKEFRFTF
jgi:glutamine phosphoribosylpyrophosphate amidotransferase